MVDIIFTIIHHLTVSILSLKCQSQITKPLIYQTACMMSLRYWHFTLHAYLRTTHVYYLIVKNVCGYHHWTSNRKSLKCIVLVGWLGKCRTSFKAYVQQSTDLFFLNILICKVIIRKEQNKEETDLKGNVKRSQYFAATTDQTNYFVLWTFSLNI